ncbi:MAG: peptide ABC transporter substrate-binding protein [Chloroflexi bacterium]|nr:peptide ABC transporter substrate-binding protein [Chloroflexota bacterium]
MFGKRFAWLLTLVLVLATILSACKPAEKLATVINLNLGTEPPTLDPQLATDTTSVQCDELLFLGLTDFDEKTMEVIPELATEWSVSDDGLTWTFKLRKDVYWVHWDPATAKAEKKRLVNAYDVEYAVKRCLDPATASDYAYVLYIIKNGLQVNTGEITDLNEVGVKAVDEWTVQFTLEKPAGYFPGIAGMWVCRPTPKEVHDQFGDKWTEPGNIWTNGPYCLDTWEHENKMVMKKNPFYYGAKDVTIETINWAMVVEESTAFAMYEAGELDVCGVPSADLDRVRADATLSKELYIAPILCTYYYGFNTTKPPFDNPKVRQAFSLAIDRQRLIDTVLKGGQKPAKTFACPGIFGSPAEDPNFPDIIFDPAKAKALLAEAGYPDGKGLPDITLMFNTSEGHKRIAEFIQSSWKENLGVEVKLANQEWAVYLKTVHGPDTPQIYRLGWCADYPDENNWVLEVFHPTLGSNDPKWSGPAAEEFARLTEEAAATSDPAKRKELYFKAEKILCVDEAVIAPIYYYTRVVCTKPYVERGYAPLGGEHIDRWKVKAH